MDKIAAFYQRFQEVCKSKERSPTNVVSGCGLSSCLVTAWRNGASPNLETIIKLAGELGVDPAELIPRI